LQIAFRNGLRNVIPFLANAEIHSDIVLPTNKSKSNDMLGMRVSDKLFECRESFASGPIVVPGQAICREGIVSDRWANDREIL
jgi:hypothetical protein